MNKQRAIKSCLHSAIMLMATIASACSTDELQTTTTQTATQTVATDSSLVINAVIHPWTEGDNLRTLSWDISNPTHPLDDDKSTLVPMVRYTQEEFNGEYAPAEKLRAGEETNGAEGQKRRYYIGENLVAPRYTAVSVKLRWLANNNQSAKQYRYTVWNGRTFGSATENGGLGEVRLGESGGKQTLSIFMPLTARNSDYQMFNGTWFVALAVGGLAGGWDHFEGFNHYYGMCANGDQAELDGDQAPYRQFGSQYHWEPTTNSGQVGATPAFTEPNRYYFPEKDQYRTYFSVTQRDQNITSEARRRGLGLVLQEAGSRSTMKRNFPLISAFVPVTTSRKDASHAVGNNTTNYAEARNIDLKPRGSILAFALQNRTGKRIKVKAIEGNHAPTGVPFNGNLSSALNMENRGMPPYTQARTYKGISYQGFYLMGATRRDGLHSTGFSPAKVRSGENPPFIGMSIGPERFPLIQSDGSTVGVLLESDPSNSNVRGSYTNGRFYWWFSAEPGSIFKVRIYYTEVDENGQESSEKVSKPQMVNPNKNHVFEDGKVYGAVIPVKVS